MPRPGCSPHGQGPSAEDLLHDPGGHPSPHFVVFCNDKKLFHFSYRRYLENQIRSVFGLEGTPIIMTVRQKGEEDS